MPSNTDSPKALGFVPLKLGNVVRVSHEGVHTFTIEELLGHGGMGAVYRARREDGSTVALKLLHDRFRHSPAIARRFAREARLANQVDHAKVANVIDGGVTDEGAPFLVSELLDGETFEARALAAGSHLPLEEVIRCADEVLDVLAAAHSRGVVHRDIKPGNIFRLKNGEVRVLDFGLAFAERDDAEAIDSQLTGASTILGTAGFMAPEMALGRWDLVDAQSDLWAVAATVLWLATGKHVHDGQTAQERLALAATRPAPSMASHAPELPRAVTVWLDEGLAFAKRDRFESARRMRSALMTLDNPTVPRPRSSRNLALMAIIAGASVATVAIARSGSTTTASAPTLAPATSIASEPALSFSAHVDASQPAVVPIPDASPIPTMRVAIPAARPAVTTTPGSASPGLPSAGPNTPNGTDENPLDRRR